MTDHFSPQFGVISTATVAPLTAYPNPMVAAEAGISHAGLKYKPAHMDFTVAANLAAADKIFIATLRSGDRLKSLKLSTAAAWAGTALTVDIGLYVAGKDGQHQGALIDVDLFASAQDLLATLTEQELLTEAGTISELDRMEPLWFMANLGAATHTDDPDEDWDIIATVNTATTVTAQAKLLFQVEYLPRGVS